MRQPKQQLEKLVQVVEDDVPQPQKAVQNVDAQQDVDELLEQNVDDLQVQNVELQNVEVLAEQNENVLHQDEDVDKHQSLYSIFFYRNYWYSKTRTATPIITGMKTKEVFLVYLMKIWNFSYCQVSCTI
jgi:hypothetical protein